MLPAQQGPLAGCAYNFEQLARGVLEDQLMQGDPTAVTLRKNQPKERRPLASALIAAHSHCKTLRTRLVEHETAFESLDGPWSTLASACRARPFQDFAWARAWVHTVGRENGRQLRIATLWEDTRLLAVLPLVRRRYCGARLLEWIG